MWGRLSGWGRPSLTFHLSTIPKPPVCSFQWRAFGKPCATMNAYTPNPQRYESIAYARCGRSGLKLPRLSLGLWHNFGGIDPLENQRLMLRRAFDLGIT